MKTLSRKSVEACAKISEQIRENVDQFLEVVEGAESLLDKAIVDMKARLDEAKDLVATAIAAEEMLKRAYQEAVDTANMWVKRRTLLCGIRTQHVQMKRNDAGDTT